MSIYTITLQELEPLNTDNRPKFAYYGLDTFPVAQEFTNKELFRQTLADKIIDHYWNREIGLESFSMWRFNFRRLLNEIMPYYNKLYVSELIKFDPLSTMAMKTTVKAGQEVDSTGGSDALATTKAKSRAVSSTFPQTQFNGQNGNYGDNGNDSLVDSENDTKATDTRSEKSSTDSESSSSGYAGSAAALLTEYRSTILNIDMMVIDRLEECFMQVFGNGDTYTGNGFML